MQSLSNNLGEILKTLIGALQSSFSKKPAIPTISQPGPAVINTQPAPEAMPLAILPTPEPVVEVVPQATSSSAVHFVIGQANPANCRNTTEARKFIRDVLGGGKNGWALQCTEYVSYRLKSKLGIDIDWPVTSGRNGGKWAAIFKAAGSYRVLDYPEVNCAMCITAGLSATDPSINETGHVTFVEDVFPDGSVKISEANWPHDGIYNERTVSKNKWQTQYKAQFVAFQ